MPATAEQQSQPEALEQDRGSFETERRDHASEQNRELLRILNELADKISNYSETIEKGYRTYGDDERVIIRHMQFLDEKVRRHLNRIQQVIGHDSENQGDLEQASKHLKTELSDLEKTRKQAEENYSREILNSPQVQKALQTKETSFYQKIPKFMRWSVPEKYRKRAELKDEQQKRRTGELLENGPTPKKTQEVIEEGQKRKEHLSKIMGGANARPEDERALYLKQYVEQENSAIPDEYMDKSREVLSRQRSNFSQKAEQQGNAIFSESEMAQEFTEKLKEFQTQKQTMQQLRHDQSLDFNERQEQIQQKQENAAELSQELSQTLDQTERTIKRALRDAESRLAAAYRSNSSQEQKRIKTEKQELEDRLQTIEQYRTYLRREKQQNGLEQAYEAEQLYEDALEQLYEAYQLRHGIVGTGIEHDRQHLDALIESFQNSINTENKAGIVQKTEAMREFFRLYKQLKSARRETNTEQREEAQRKIRELVAANTQMREADFSPEHKPHYLEDAELLQQKVNEAIQNARSRADGALPQETQNTIDELNRLVTEYKTIRAPERGEPAFEELQQKREQKFSRISTLMESLSATTRHEREAASEEESDGEIREEEPGQHKNVLNTARLYFKQLPELDNEEYKRKKQELQELIENENVDFSETRYQRNLWTLAEDLHNAVLELAESKTFLFSSFYALEEALGDVSSLVEGDEEAPGISTEETDEALDDLKTRAKPLLEQLQQDDPASHKQFKNELQGILQVGTDVREQYKKAVERWEAELNQPGEGTDDTSETPESDEAAETIPQEKKKAALDKLYEQVREFEKQNSSVKEEKTKQLKKQLSKLKKLKEQDKFMSKQAEIESELQNIQQRLEQTKALWEVIFDQSEINGSKSEQVMRARNQFKKQTELLINSPKEKNKQRLIQAAAHLLAAAQNAGVTADFDQIENAIQNTAQELSVSYTKKEQKEAPLEGSELSEIRKDFYADLRKKGILTKFEKSTGDPHQENTPGYAPMKAGEALTEKTRELSKKPTITKEQKLELMSLAKNLVEANKPTNTDEANAALLQLGTNLQLPENEIQTISDSEQTNDTTRSSAEGEPSVDQSTRQTTSEPPTENSGQTDQNQPETSSDASTKEKEKTSAKESLNRAWAEFLIRLPVKQSRANPELHKTQLDALKTDLKVLDLEKLKREEKQTVLDRIKSLAANKPEEEMVFEEDIPNNLKPLIQKIENIFHLE